MSVNLLRFAPKLLELDLKMLRFAMQVLDFAKETSFVGRHFCNVLTEAVNFLEICI